MRIVRKNKIIPYVNNLSSNTIKSIEIKPKKKLIMVIVFGLTFKIIKKGTKILDSLFKKNSIIGEFIKGLDVRLNFNTFL